MLGDAMMVLDEIHGLGGSCGENVHLLPTDVQGRPHYGMSMGMETE